MTVVVLVIVLAGRALYHEVNAQTPVTMLDEVEAYAHEEITVSTAAIGVTVANIQPPSPTPRAKRLLLTTVGDLRYCVDGTTPTASTCHHVTDGASWVLSSTADMRRLRMIREDGTDAKVAATFSH